MMRRSMSGAMLLLMASTAAAPAAPATPEEAKRLTAVIEDYVGHPAPGQPGAVTVSPHGEAYTATLDVTRLLSFTSAFGVDLRAGDLMAELTPETDGQWHVTVAGVPPVGVGGKGVTSSYTFKDYTFDGHFDPKIQAFSTSKGTSRGSTTQMRGENGPVDIDVTSESTASSKATAAAPGTVDVAMDSSSTGVDYRITRGAAAAATDTAGTPAQQVIDLKAASLQSSLQVHGMQAVALNDLSRFLIAHPSRATLVAAQPELKIRLKAVIPLAVSAAGTASLAKMTLSTVLGAFALDSLKARYGSDADGNSGNTLSLQMVGLTLPDRLVPTWAEPLVPVSLDYTQSSGPVRTSEALKMAVDDVDLASDKPLSDTQQAEILQAFGFDHMTVTVSPSTIATALMTIKISGEARIDKPQVTAMATIAASGLDKTIAAVRTAAPDDPNGMQAISMLMAAKALGKAEGPDSYFWVVAQDASGQITVNGVALGAPAPKPLKRKTEDLP